MFCENQDYDDFWGFSGLVSRLRGNNGVAVGSSCGL